MKIYRSSSGGASGSTGGADTRSYKVDIQELIKRTKCRRCGQEGHWEKECPLPARSNASGPNASTRRDYVQGPGC